MSAVGARLGRFAAFGYVARSMRWLKRRVGVAWYEVVCFPWVPWPGPFPAYVTKFCVCSDSLGCLLVGVSVESGLLGFALRGLWASRILCSLSCFMLWAAVAF